MFCIIFMKDGAFALYCTSCSKRSSKKPTFLTRMHRHNNPSLIQFLTDMSFLLRTRKALYLLGFCAVLVTAVSVRADGNFLSPLGGEFSVLGGQVGDQVHPALSLTANGGVVTWEDNGIDKSGSGIGMRRLDG